MSLMERLVDEKARSKMVIVDGRSVKLERFIPKDDLPEVFSYPEHPTG